MAFGQVIRKRLPKTMAIVGSIVFCIFMYWIQQLLFTLNYEGKYYLGFEGQGCILSINKDHSFLLTHVAQTPKGLAKGKTFHGKYTIRNGFLKTSLEGASLSEAACLVTRYAFVEWQGRKYLLAYDYDNYIERSQWQKNQLCERIRNNEELESEKSGEVPVFTNMQDLENIPMDLVIEERPRLLGIVSFCPK
jgi:hypothetical protein